jgi:hypothetical protein
VDPARVSSQRGQASVELVALLPLIVVVALALWQAAVTGHAMWSAASAARSAARAGAIGTLDDARAAARRVLPGSLDRGVRVHRDEDGEVTVSVRIPSVFGGAAGTWSAHARMAPQR